MYFVLKWNRSGIMRNTLTRYERNELAWLKIGPRKLRGSEKGRRPPCFREEYVKHILLTCLEIK